MPTRFTAVQALVAFLFVWMLTIASFGYVFQDLNTKMKNFKKDIEVLNKVVDDLQKTPCIHCDDSRKVGLPEPKDESKEESTLPPKYVTTVSEDLKFNFSTESAEWNNFRKAFGQVKKEVKELRTSYRTLQRHIQTFQHHGTFAHISGGGNVGRNFNSKNYSDIKHVRAWAEESGKEGPTHWTGQIEYHPKKHRCLVVQVSGWYYVFSQIYFYDNGNSTEDLLYQIVECQRGTNNEKPRTLMKSFADKKEYTSNYQGGIFHFHREDKICVKLSDDTKADFGQSTSHFGMFHVANPE